MNTCLLTCLLSVNTRHTYSTDYFNSEQAENNKKNLRVLWGFFIIYSTIVRLALLKGATAQLYGQSSATFINE